jgi:3-oxoacyl-[acyl-carrier-protein] synthase III
LSWRARPVEGVVITGAGSAYPEDVGAGASLDEAGVYAALLGSRWEAELDARAWDRSRTQSLGVTRRGWLRGTGRTSLDLAIEAGRRALQRASVDPAEVDLLVVATCTPANITSSMSSRVAAALGMESAALDVRAGGAAGLDAWITAANFHAQGCRTSLVIAAEASSHYLTDGDLNNALLFADGAGALVLESGVTESGLQSGEMGHRTLEGSAFTVPGPLPPDAEEVAKDAYRFQSPDSSYRAGLSELWIHAREQLGDHDTCLPYAVHADQVRAATQGENGWRETLGHLDARGCLGCAGPIALIADTWAAGTLASGEVLGSFAVGGGVSWSTLTWRI